MRGRVKKLYAAIALALVAVMVASTAAIAAVTFDPATGQGFVGKGDVQLAFNWNNKQLQNNAKTVSFTFQDQAKYEVPCEKDTGKKIMEQTFNRSTTLNADIAYETRDGKKQITGYNLTGFGTTTVDGQASCPEGWSADGDPVLVSTSGGQLFVSSSAAPGSGNVLIYTVPEPAPAA